MLNEVQKLELQAQINRIEGVILNDKLRLIKAKAEVERLEIELKKNEEKLKTKKEGKE